MYLIIDISYKYIDLSCLLFYFVKVQLKFVSSIYNFHALYFWLNTFLWKIQELSFLRLCKQFDYNSSLFFILEDFCSNHFHKQYIYCKSTMKNIFCQKQGPAIRFQHENNYCILLTRLLFPVDRRLLPFWVSLTRRRWRCIDAHPLSCSSET